MNVLPMIHEPTVKKGKRVLRSLPIGSLLPNPMQPRVMFDAITLEELAESIREHGIEQTWAIIKMQIRKVLHIDAIQRSARKIRQWWHKKVSDVIYRRIEKKLRATQLEPNELKMLKQAQDALENEYPF